MRITISAVLFFATFLFSHLIGCMVFPISENNVLDAPGWYPIAVIAISFIVSYAYFRLTNPERNPNRLDWIFSNKVRRYEIAKKVILMNGYASESILQQKFGVKYSEAHCIVEKMISDGVAKRFSPETNSEKEHKPFSFNKKEQQISNVDLMDGHEFEYWCASLLLKNGFSSADVTPGSGDHGVDVVAIKDQVRYAIQCKCYTKDLGNTPVQEVYAGKEMYRCQVGVVMTNQHFTKGAKELAENTRVLLWDRDKIIEMIESGV